MPGLLTAIAPPHNLDRLVAGVILIGLLDADRLSPGRRVNVYPSIPTEPAAIEASHLTSVAEAQHRPKREVPRAGGRPVIGIDAAVHGRSSPGIVSNPHRHRCRAHPLDCHRRAE